jgi:hypothetical protein
MAAEPYVISNPRENNRILAITRLTSGGGIETIARVRPGETYRADLDQLTIRMVPVPARLVVQADGTIRPDTNHAPPRLRSR